MPTTILTHSHSLLTVLHQCSGFVLFADGFRGSFLNSSAERKHISACLVAILLTSALSSRCGEVGLAWKVNELFERTVAKELTPYAMMRPGAHTECQHVVCSQYLKDDHALKESMGWCHGLPAAKNGHIGCAVKMSVLLPLACSGMPLTTHPLAPGTSCRADQAL